MKAFSYFIFFSCFIYTFFIFGCENSPSSVGKKVIRGEDFGNIKIDTFYATSHTSYYNVLNTLGVSRMMLGKKGSYEAWACIKFLYFPDSLVNATIKSASIRLKTVSHFGDSLGTLDFEVHQINRGWDTLSGDLLKNDLDHNDGYYYEFQPLNVNIPSFSPGDSQYVTINILDTALIKRWFASTSDTTKFNQGIILKPKSTSNVIRGFASYISTDTASAPVLNVEYENSNGTGYFSNYYSISKYISDVDSSDFLKDTANFMYLQNGISYRSFLSFDNVSFPGPFTIVNATLQLTLPSDSTSLDYLTAFSVGTDGKSDGLFLPKLSELLTADSGRHIFQFNLTEFANRWRTGLSTRKVGFNGLSELTSFDLFRIYASGSGVSNLLKPKIIITYSIKN